jgi:site-specific recombinase XerD
MTQTPAILHQQLTMFLRSLAGNNVSENTRTAYHTDLVQFFTWLAENDLTVERPDRYAEAISLSIFPLSQIWAGPG